MKDADQLRLVERIRTGDVIAEKELFLRYKNPIHWKVLRRIDTDVENIKDLVSEIFLAIIEGVRKTSFQPERWDSLDAYVWGITNHKINDWFKKKKVERRILDCDPPSEDIAASTEEYFLEKKELAEIARKLLKGLPAKYKEALDLRYFQELSIREISAQLGLAPRRVSERIHYALKLLRKAFHKK
jgi:RNA polymerase sigma-70 factor (ECF subfamily)